METLAGRLKQWLGIRWVRAFAGAILTLLLADAVNVLALLNRGVTDLHTQWRVTADPKPFPEDILVIGIDDTALRRYGRLRNWSRSRYADLLGKLGQAKAVGVDILFTEPDERDKAGDLALAEAVKRNGKVVLPLFVYNETRPVNAETQGATKATLARLPAVPETLPDLGFENTNPQAFEPPFPTLRDATAAICYASVNADADGVYRQPILVRYTGDSSSGYRLIPHFTVALASIATGISLTDALKDSPGGGAASLKFGTNAPIVSLTQGSVYLHSIARRGGGLREAVGKPAPYLSFADAIGEKPERFKDKIVLIGETITGTADIRPNPLDTGLRGVELNAEILANLLVVRPLTGTPALVKILLCTVAILVPALLYQSVSTKVAALGSLGALVLLIGVMEFQFWSLYTVVPFTEVVLALAASMLIAGLARAGEEAAIRRRLQDSFSAYVAPEMVDSLVKNPQLVLEGTRRIRCGILFSDIRSFTSYTEQNSPDIVDRQMREYLTEMTASVFARKHFLDKFIGDAVMALFGPFKEEEENWSAEAVLCAIDMLERLDRLNAGWTAEGLPTFRIGIGVHTGDVLFGNIGSDNTVGNRRIQLTALGDNVNLAARLQTETKEQKVTLLVSEEVKNEAEDALRGIVTFEDKGILTVRGRQTATHIYSVSRV